MKNGIFDATSFAEPFTVREGKCWLLSIYFINMLNNSYVSIKVNNSIRLQRQLKLIPILRKKYFNMEGER